MAAAGKRGTVTVTGREWIDEIQAAARGVLREREPMKEHTTLGVGGPAELWFEPEDADSLASALSIVRRRRIAYCVVGGGSNLLVGDEGIAGLVVHLGPGFAEIEETPVEGGAHVTFPAGISTSAVRRFARVHGLVGPEFLVGIPGSLGGAIQMNAGTRLGEMVDVVVGAEVAHPEGARWIDAEAFGFAYRHAVVPPGGIVTRIRLALRAADETTQKSAQDAAKAELKKRHASQPKGKSAGSIFKNPKEDYAGRLIEASGLKGRRVGGAVVSEVHANFIINEGGASARDVLTLIEICRDTVRRQHGVGLELEVRLLGTF